MRSISRALGWKSRGPQGIQASFDWQAAYDSVAGQMCTVVLKNQVGNY
ncbi:hypothetical protein ACFOHS_02570 [Jhaorihella thermophila]